MKKVIKPSKQPTKKRSKQTAETAKLKIAIGKISTQLVKDHPKLIKGGGSLGITELLFSKILIKGGKLSQQTRGYIIEFLIDIAPQVNKLKQELIRKLLENLIGKDIIIETNICKNIIDINGEFDKGLYEYEIKDDIQYQIGNLSDEIKEYIAILDIVKKYYILSRVKDDEEKASIKEEINNNKFVQLPSNILEALKKGNKELKKLINDYFEKKKIDSGNGAPEVEEKNYKDTLANLRTTLVEINKGVKEFKALFSSDKITIGRGDEKYNFDSLKIPNPTEIQKEALKDLNLLYSEFSINVYDKYFQISIKYDNEGNIYTKEEIEKDLKDLLELNETLKDQYILPSRKDRIKTLLDIIDPARKKVKTPPGSTSPALMEVDDILTDGRLIDRSPTDIGWAERLEIPGDQPTSPRGGGNPAKYKSTGQVVYIMYKNKKYKRVIYVKDKRNTRYCKINKEYILLSKLKVIQLH
jgi:hypothetical protein